MSSPPDWSALLDSTERGFRSTLANAVAVIQNDPTLDYQHIYHDPFLDRIMRVNSPTRPWTDEDDYEITVYMQETIGLSTMSDQLVSKAVRMVARQRPRNSAQEYLKRLVWDGQPHINTALERLWGVCDFASHPQAYVQAVSANFLIGMVARVERPGCKLDTMPVFEGSQGIAKSSALEVLASTPWFASARDTIGTKDFLMALRGKWIVEIAELDAFSKAELTAIKSTMSTPIDTYRPPYGYNVRDYPRMGVFAGTTNKDDWAIDATGGRRFWPIQCGVINVAAIAAERDQLFAEARVRFAAGDSWWLTPESAIDVQADRHNDDVWTDAVLTWLTGRANVTTMEILRDALRFRDADAGRPEQIRVANILRHAGWKRRTIRRNGYPTKAFINPTVTEEESVTFE